MIVKYNRITEARAYACTYVCISYVVYSTVYVMFCAQPLTKIELKSCDFLGSSRGTRDRHAAPTAFRVPYPFTIIIYYIPYTYIYNAHRNNIYIYTGAGIYDMS